MLSGCFGSCVVNGQVYYRGQSLLRYYYPVEVERSVRNDMAKVVFTLKLRNTYRGNRKWYSRRQMQRSITLKMCE